MQPFRFGNIESSARSDRANRDFYDCLKLLLEHGVNPDALMNGNTVLHALADSEELSEAERLEFAKILLDAGASLTIRDTGTLKSTPIGWACRWGRIDLVRLYLKQGAAVQEPHAHKWATPIARAQANGHLEIVKLLQQHAAG